jgi:hypothetical protein
MGLTPDKSLAAPHHNVLERLGIVEVKMWRFNLLRTNNSPVSERQTNALQVPWIRVHESLQV